MKKNIIFCLLLALGVLHVYAQDRKNTRAARVGIADAFTRATLKDSKLTVMDTDSTVLLVPENIFLEFLNAYKFVCRMPIRDKYILKAECPGYETAYTELTFKSGETGKDAGDILLHRAAIQLDEVEIVGSKVLMVNRGDTIVYNASAFQLSNGSMLDALIKQLPGVELHSGGRITVNGEYVSALLVNGRDFFKGDPKIALDNLPAYYVDRVEVYRQASELRKVMYGDTIKADKKEDPYVMDVKLKRDYAQGWLGNAEAGYGTHDRYMARLFGMRYTTHSGLFLFGNINNLNNAQTAEKDGGWAGRTSNEGTEKARTFGINFSGDDKVTKMKYSTAATVSTTDGDYEDIKSTDSYYSTGDVFQRSRSKRSKKTTTASWKANWSYPNYQKFRLSVIPSIVYTKTKNHGYSRIASFLDNPYDSYRGAAIDSLYSPLGSQRLTKLLINQHEWLTQSNTDDVTMNIMSLNSFKIGQKWMSVNVKANYDNHHRKYFDVDNYHYGDPTSHADEMQNKYTRRPSMAYEYQAQVGYHLFNKHVRNNETFLELSYKYRQRFTSGDRQLYRLDRYENYNRLAMLPSTTDSLQTAIDLRNSYHTTHLTRENGVEVDFKYMDLQVTVPFSMVYERMNDLRANQNRNLSKTRPYLNPQVYFNHKHFRARYIMETWMPDMGYLMDIRDDSDPLNISLGNDNLKYTYRHSFNMSYNRTQKQRQRHYNIYYGGDITQNAISMSRNYDLSTGITTLRPENIKGNWRTWTGFSFGEMIDKQRRLMLTTSTDASYNHNADYATFNSRSNSQRNIVKNLWLGETVKAEYHRNGLYAITGHIDWNHSESPNEQFTTINAIDFNYGATISKTLWKHLDFNTEMMMWSRRGYTDKTMNDDELIWNLSLSYAFGHLGQWIVKAEGCDILRSQNSVRQTMNAQGRTETWYKTIPSYWMLHLMYQFKKAPKKKNQGI